jgi:hypothetical protein
MSALIQPWGIHDAEMALWPAWKDGMPMRGPFAEDADGRRWPEPLFYCKANLNIAETWAPGEAGGLAWQGVAEAVGKSYKIAVDFPDGAVQDAWGRVTSRLPEGGMYVLTVRYAAGGVWTTLRFFHTVVESDGSAESGQVMMRPLRFAAGWMQEDTGSGTYPSLDPLVYGEVDWVCGSRRIPCMRYDPLAEEWTSRVENDIGDGTRFVNISPVDASEGADVFVSYYVPRTEEVEPGGGKLRRRDIVWTNRIAFSVGRWDSPTTHGLRFTEGYALQAGNHVEPLEMIPQGRVLDEPVVVFHYIGRVYASLGHGVLAVPGLTEGVVEARHDPMFRISPTGGNNPETGDNGLTLLPDRAWLDGAVAP